MDPDVQEVPLTTKRPTAQPSDPLESLEKALENACANMAVLCESVIDFSYDSQSVIFSKVNEFVKDLKEIEEKCKNVNAVIPYDVIDAIDKGRNPEHVTYQLLEACAEANNMSRGKLQAMRAFYDELEKLNKEIPESAVTEY